VKEAYRNKKWAFVADFFRFEILALHGGVYMDTDMLLLKPIRSFLKFNGFIGFEDNIHVSAGIIGAQPSNGIIISILVHYQKLKFSAENPIVINSSLNLVFERLGLKTYNTEQIISGFKMYSSKVFYPFSFEDSKKNKDYKLSLVSESVAVHLWNHSWGDEFSEFSKGNTLKGISKAISKILKNPVLPKQYYKRLAKNVIYSINRR
jgi:hypothetical protein